MAKLEHRHAQALLQLLHDRRDLEFGRHFLVDAKVLARKLFLDRREVRPEVDHAVQHADSRLRKRRETIEKTRKF
jgi:hypothetical protein